jgi:hypothetical protein
VFEKLTVPASEVLAAVELQTRWCGMLFCVVTDFEGDHITFKFRANQSKKINSLE